MSNPYLADQLGEALASKLIRMLHERGVGPEDWQVELDRLMVELGFRRIEGVWFGPKDLS